MAQNVIVIPATIDRFTASPIASQKKRRVAAYARVSTDQEEQLTSYEAQKDYYTNYIQSREDWEFAGLYADEGKSGCNTKKRDSFRSMIEDALDGRIDLIITKSVSRFARNTVDSLSTIRKLKENNIEVYFEKENIWSFDGKGEIMLTIMSSLAQEEARSISENCTWGHRKRMSDGKYSAPYSRFLGYDKGEDGKFAINEEQAALVRRIFALFLQGRSPAAIAKLLMDEGVKTGWGRDKWYPSTVKIILQNEKYTGCALLQKTYTADYLTKKTKKNKGEVPQYFVEDGHPAIIDKETFETVQRMLSVRKPGKNRASCTGLFSSMVRCCDCGGWYGRKIHHSTDKYRKVVYRCNRKYDDGQKCSTPVFTEDELKEIFVKAANSLISRRDEVTGAYDKDVLDAVYSVDEEKEQRRRLQVELRLAADAVKDCIERNARVAQDQAAYEAEYDRLTDEYERVKGELAGVEAAISEKVVQRDTVERFLAELSGKDEPLITFDEDALHGLVDHIEAKAKDDVTVVFKDGTEVKVEGE
ncbi:MAG: hypothetical protein BACD_00123 [Bacteroides rodentium]